MMVAQLVVAEVVVVVLVAVAVVKHLLEVVVADIMI
jgi:hypothetical protein